MANFEAHTYGADTPHKRRRYQPLKVTASTSDEAKVFAKSVRPLSHISMCLPICPVKRTR